MTTWDRLLESNRWLASEIEELAPAMTEMSLATPPVEFLLSRGVAPSAAYAVVDEATPNGGTYGLGLWIREPGAPPEPVVAVIPELAPSGRAPLVESAAAPWWGGLMPDDLVLVPMSPPQWHSDLRIGSELASRGVAVRDRVSGRAGFLTAGHAAPEGASVVDMAAGTVLGTVTRSLRLPQGGDRDDTDPTPRADVAFVATDATWPPGDRPPLVRSASDTDFVSRGAPPHLSSDAYFFNFVYRSFQVEPGRFLGYVSQTNRSFSSPGDSGAPAYARSDGAILGHVLGGGALGDYSLVQDLDFQMGEIGVVL